MVEDKSRTDSTAAPGRPLLAVLASKGARAGASSPLLRFVRDYISKLQQFTIVAPAGTARAIIGTGLFNEFAQSVIQLLPGSSGGVVQVAALAARDKCDAVVFFSDPADLWSDGAANRALKRVCVTRRIRLITTYEGARDWALYGLGPDYIPHAPPPILSEPDDERVEVNVDEHGEFRSLPLSKQTLALIAHDGLKSEMARFVADKRPLLSSFGRILATGTTGWLLLLRHAPRETVSELEEKASGQLGQERFAKLKSDIEQLGRSEPDQHLVKILRPLESGPKGGDVLIAEQVLRNRCQAIVFFQDPTTAHAHDPDIRLLERVAQLRTVYCSCVSDPASAKTWADSQEAKARDPNRCSGAEALRSMLGLREAILVDPPTIGSVDDTRTRLARALVGYLIEAMSDVSKSAEIVRIGVSGGGMIRLVLQEAADRKHGFVNSPRQSGGRNPFLVSDRLMWIPLNGEGAGARDANESVLFCKELATLFEGSCAIELGQNCTLQTELLGTQKELIGLASDDLGVLVLPSSSLRAGEGGVVHEGRVRAEVSSSLAMVWRSGAESLLADRAVAALRSRAVGVLVCTPLSNVQIAALSEGR
jgi:methylglyoxal synthase